MTTTERLFDSGIDIYELDPQMLASAVEMLEQCAEACRICADLAILDAEPAHMSDCIRACLGCADLCHATASLIARHGAFAVSDEAAVLAACARICRATAAECDRHDADHCRLCAEACRRAASACRAFLKDEAIEAS